MLENLINPQVMADMISAKVENAIRVLPYAKIDTTLQGNAGDTITIPKFEYIGDAVVVAEGADIPIRTLKATSAQFTIKKIATGVGLTDEAVLSAHGNPVGEATTQLATAILSTTDTDGLDALLKATTTVAGDGYISYKNIVNAIDAFQEEVNTQKVIFVHPSQLTQLRLDPDFIDRNKYGNAVMMNGEVGMVANCRVVVSRKVPNNGTLFTNPIVQLRADTETQDDSPALTIFLKRDTNVERERQTRNRTTEITVDKLYVAALTNDSKVVLMTVAAPAAAAGAAAPLTDTVDGEAPLETI